MSDYRNYKLNYKFKEPDARDYAFSNKLNSKQVSSLPFQKTIESKIKNVLDQGDLGSCVSNVFAQYILIVTSNTIFISRLFHYYCGRLISGYSNLVDSGLNVRKSCQIISTIGVCKEYMWPYITSNYTIIPPIFTFQYSNCRLFKKYTYSFINQSGNINTINDIKTFLNVFNLPVIFGFMVYSSFYSNSTITTGIVSLPDTTKEIFEGGHCMLIVGYDDEKKQLKCVNSWGSSWGDKGYCYMPYDYITNAKLCNDFCILSISY